MIPCERCPVMNTEQTSQRSRHAFRLDGETPGSGQEGKSQPGRGALLRWAGRGTDDRARRSNTPSLLGLLLTNEEVIIDKVGTEAPVGKSDHVIQRAAVNVDVKEPCTRTRRNYNKANYLNMKKELSLNWVETLPETDDIDTIWSKFEDKLSSSMDTHISTVSPKARKYRYPLDKAAKSVILRKNKLWKRVKTTKSEVDYRLFCRTRNQVSRLTRKAQKILE